MGQREHPGEDDEWRLEAVRGAWPGVQAVGNSIELFLTIDAQVRSLGQVLAQQAVGVLSGAALPWAVRITEVHRHARSGGQLLAMVVDEALPRRRSNRIQLLREARQR